MDKQTLYDEELKLLKELVKNETEPNKEYQNAVKRTIARINDDLEVLDKPSD